MAILTTERLGIKRWDSGADAFIRADMDDSHAQLEARVAGFDNGGSQPTAGADKAGFFHYTTTDSSVGQLSYCNGDTYFDIAVPGTVLGLDGALSHGSADTFARSDHKHSLDAGVVSTSSLGDDAVTTAKINSGAVTNAKLASSGLSASKLTTGTLPIDRIADGAIVGAKLADGAVTNAKLASFGLDASKFTAGVMPAAQIPELDASQVTSGVFDVLRIPGLGGTYIEDGAVGTLQLADTAVTNAKLGSDLNASKITAGTLAAARLPNLDAATITSGTLSIDRIGTGAIVGAKLADGAVTDAKVSSVAASKISGTLAESQIPDNMPLSKINTSGLTVTVGAGTIGSTQLASNAVTNAKVASVDATKITSGLLSDDRLNATILRKTGLVDYKVFGGTGYGSSTRNANTANTIYVKSSQPTTGLQGDIWVKT